MAKLKLYGDKVAVCHQCGGPIGLGTPKPFCPNCDEPLPQDTLCLIPVLYGYVDEAHRNAIDMKVTEDAPVQEKADGATQAYEPVSEGGIARVVGGLIIAVNVIGAITCIFTLAKYKSYDPEFPSDALFAKTHFNPGLVIAFIAWGLNGVTFGYLIMKIGSILRHLERRIH